MKPLEKLRYLSISTRISILLGIIILLTMGAFSTFSLVKQKEDAIKSISSNTEQLNQTIEKILRVSMLKNRRDDISSAINNIVGNENIKSIRILNHDGVIKFSSVKSDIDDNISQKSQLCVGCHEKGNINHTNNLKNFNSSRLDEKNNLIYYSLPIYNDKSCYGGPCHSSEIQSLNSDKRIDDSALSLIPAHDSSRTILGFIEIDVSIKKIISELNGTQNQLMILTVLFALIASLITYFSIQYFIGKPVNNLMEGTLRVAKGNFHSEIPPGKAELGVLAESFNKMQKQLIFTQTQLIESEKLASVGKLSDEIAHEINNPLTGIIVFSESLLNDPKIADLKNDVEFIREEALKIRQSIRNILSLTKRDKPVFKPSNLSKIILQAISVVEKLSNFRNIKIITSVPKTLPNISADSNLMEQVFLNLLLLSSEFMEGGGIINVIVSVLANSLEVNFNYSGSIMPSNILQNIFEPSNDVEIAEYRKIKISLGVCKDIVEMHKGNININLTETGTIVIIELPKV